jgi:hypothetical protein
MKKIYRMNTKLSKSKSKKQKVIKTTRKKCRLKPVGNKKELQELTKQIKVSHRHSSLALLRIYMTKNWSELGYSSFKDFVEKCLPQENYETVLSRVTCDEVAFELGGEQAVGRFSMNAMRTIKAVKGEERTKLWLALNDEAKESSKGMLTPDWLTAARVEEVIKSLFGSQEDDSDQDCPTDDPTPEDKHYNSDEQEVSDEEKTNNHASVIPDKKSLERETSQPKKDKPHSEIEINEAKSNVISRITKSEALQVMLEEYDGSESLAKIISLYSVETFDVKTLARMMKVLMRGIYRKKQSEPKVLEVQS